MPTFVSALPDPKGAEEDFGFLRLSFQGITLGLLSGLLEAVDDEARDELEEIVAGGLGLGSGGGDNAA